MNSRLNLETIPSGKAPGQLLRTARQSMGLTVDDVAAELRLAPDQITALEENDFQQLAGQTYVRGYLRSYARLVDLPAEHIVPSGDDKRFAMENTDAVVPAPRRKFKHSSSPAKVLTYIFLIVLVGLVMVWWYQRAGIKPPGAGEQLGAMPPLEIAVAANDGVPTVDGMLLDTKRESKITSAGSAQDALLIMAAEEYAVPDSATDDAAGSESPNSVESAAAGVATSVPAPAVVPDPVVPEPVVSEPVTIETAATIPVMIKQLVLYFAAPTWAEVRDAQSQLLLAETVTLDQVVALQGTPPFAVNIGRAAGVQVGYEGKLYNVTPRNDDASARFSVGKFGQP
ncbi:MAG: DUF4115 domain-containing protein [Gammaproteobacteria bacterium]|nr:DUF4115 domain-containing protein [Gammaproteobacteria bacterium]MDH3468157.1 DUF4115 domain-containing protein [Gammaproteobacteria bacterium]